jgi:hypothetical protein
MFAQASVVALAILGGLAKADDPAAILAPPPFAAPSPMPATPPIVPPVIPLPAPALAPPVVIPAAGCPCDCGGGGTQFGIDLMLGMQSGIRGQWAFQRTEKTAWVIEGFYGALLDKLGSGEGAGFGGRYYYRRTNVDGCNSLLLGPGVGAYYHFHDEVWMLAPTLDVGWVRAISDTGAWEIGLNAGFGIGLNNGRDYEEAGKVTPLFTLYTGFRF